MRGWVTGGCVFGVWLATPCTSWSRARHGPFGSSWGPLRSNQHIYGIPGLRSDDVCKSVVGNQTMKCIAHIVRLCEKFHVPTFLEIPAGSMLWLAPPIARCCRFSGSQKAVCDFCQNGARWRKRARIPSWNASQIPYLSYTCQGHGGYHIVLKGQDPKSKQVWSHIAQPYPKRCAAYAADALIYSHDCVQNHHLKRFYGIWFPLLFCWCFCLLVLFLVSCCLFFGLFLFRDLP